MPVAMRATASWQGPLPTEAAVIGLSNVFDVAGDLESGWVAAAAIAASPWGEMTTVGYGSGDSFDAAHRGGFKSTVNLWCG
jgi:hypothetical protein